MNERVSVITTVLNEARSIEALLQSLLNQSQKPDEIIIVDGGSSDGTVELIDKYSKTNDSIHLIIKEGVNIAQGRNLAIQDAIYPLVAVIDAGCSPDERWLEELIKPFEENSSPDAVAGLVKVKAHNLFEFFSGLLTLPGSLEEIAENNFPMYGRSAAFKKEIWERARGYPEWLYTAEDALFDKKLRFIGASIKLAKGSLVYWRPRKTLRKMAKMFYLYGKGNGRIGTNVNGAYYHVRNYLIGLVLLFISFFYPLALLLLTVFTGYFYMGFYRPIINKVKKVSPGWSAEFYVPLIVFVKTLSYCAGLLSGRYEYRHNPLYRENLELYLKKSEKEEWDEKQKEFADWGKDIEGRTNNPMENLWRYKEKIYNETILKYTKEGTRGLEIGSGVGRTCNFLKEKERYMVGIEPLSHKNIYNLVTDSLLSAMGEYLPFRDDSFDFAITKDTIDHTMSPQSVFHEVNRVLKSNSYFIVCQNVKDRDHQHVFEIETIKELGKKANFKLILIIPLYIRIPIPSWRLRMSLKKSKLYIKINRLIATILAGYAHQLIFVFKKC